MNKVIALEFLGGMKLFYIQTVGRSHDMKAIEEYTQKGHFYCMLIKKLKHRKINDYNRIYLMGPV